MERENVKIVTPIDKHEILVKKWLTGGESEAIQEVFLAQYELTTNDGKPESKTNIKGSVINQAKHKTIETMIISVDGKKEDILKTVLDFKANDYNYLVEEVNKLNNQQPTAEKKSV